MIKRILASILLAAIFLPSVVFAQGTLLPNTDDVTFEYIIETWDAYTVEQKQDLQKNNGVTSACDYYFWTTYGDNFTFVYKDKSNFIQSLDDREIILSCAIQSGRVSLWMLPYFITYIANFFIGISGVISLLFVVLGGFWYMTGGITDDKEKGKKTIFYALVGLVITLLAWIIVNVIQVQVSA